MNPNDVLIDLDPIEHLKAVRHSLYTMTVSGRCQMDPHKIYNRTFEERLAEDVRSHCAAIALGKYLQRPYRFKLNTFQKLPVLDDPDMDVRTIDDPDDCLIFRKQYPPERWQVLVLGNPPTEVDGNPVQMRIIGCIRGTDAQRSEWIRDPNGHHRPAWFVPQNALYPAKVLPWL